MEAAGLLYQGLRKVANRSCLPCDFLCPEVKGSVGAREGSRLVVTIWGSGCPEAPFRIVPIPHCPHP